MSIECYAQRLLNPFRGAVHVIRHASAEAVTTDGVHWDIYVSNDALRRDLPQDCAVQTNDIRYGSWSADKGLKRGPINLYEDFLAMEAMGAQVYAHLLELHAQVPFAYADQYELWLLDRDQQPLALLASACNIQDVAREPATARWQAGFAARERFRSTAMGEDAAGAAADHLTAYVNALAGPTPTVQWFHRQPDGSGLGLASSKDALAGRGLPAGAFPRFVLAEQGHDARHRRLIEDYHAWLAPWLLLLPGLNTQTRAVLERQARAQAQEVMRQHRLYPRVVDQAQINAALVEAMLVSSQAKREREDNALSTFYIELNPGVGEYL
ncbi:MAG: hypothetical protein NZ524_03990 [Thiobacillaceae bacterium]|nr:hypothetical protein [Thiobacillaceae bacterium]MDW8323523.1 hypothetical protein [Burkholderiales bacterium]